MARLSDGVAAPNMREVRRTNPALTSRQPQRYISRAPKPYVTPLPVTPSYVPSPTVTQSPYYVPPSAPVNNWNTGQQSFGGGGMATTMNSAPAAPVDPPKPPPPPKKTVDDFAKLYDTNQELAAVDSTFAEQRSLYAQLLKKYLADHDVNMKNIGEDARLGKEGIEKNRVRGLTSLNEDFAARGLGYSGLVAKEHDDTSQAFKKQDANVDLQRVRGETDLNSRKNKYVGENGENGSNMSAARREAYARLVAKQDIV